MTSKPRGPSDSAASTRDDSAHPRDDVEGHGIARGHVRNADDVEGHGIARGHVRNADPDDGSEDVEGHSMLLDPGIARDLARAREKEIQKRAERHGLEEEARRPLNRKR
jgi:hypothetical protein